MATNKTVNRIELIGYMGAMPEMRFTANGAAVTNFSSHVARCPLLAHCSGHPARLVALRDGQSTAYGKVELVRYSPDAQAQGTPYELCTLPVCYIRPTDPPADGITYRNQT